MKEELLKLLDRVVTIYSVNYIYAGVLTAVHDDCAVLQSAYIVYDTGRHETDTYADLKPYPKQWHVAFNLIEAFGEFKGLS